MSSLGFTPFSLQKVEHKVLLVNVYFEKYDIPVVDPEISKEGRGNDYIDF